jgi:paraquat-inducible protein B
LDEILSKNAVEAQAISQDVIHRSIVTFKAGIDKLSDAAIAKFQAHNQETDDVMVEVESLLQAHLTRNDRNAKAVLFAIAEMSTWKASEDMRKEDVVALQTRVAVKRNAVHSGSEITGNNRLLHYRCIGELVRHFVVGEEESPRCSIVFPGKYLTQSPNGFSTSISKFSDLTLGLCPNCLQFYQIEEVNLSKLIESAKETISNRLRHDQWSEPVIRPHDGSRPIQFSEQREKKIRKKEAAGANVVVALIEELKVKLEEFQSKSDNDKQKLVQITYNFMIGKINSQLECTDCMTRKQWDTLRAIQVEITDLRELHKDPKSKHNTRLNVALTQLRIKKGRIPTTAPVSPRRDKFSHSPERSLPDSVLRRKR